MSNTGDSWVLFRAHLEGVSSLLQNRADPMVLLKATTTDTRKAKAEVKTPRELAERAAYRDNEGKLIHPARAVFKAICAAAREHKQKGSRRNLSFAIPAAVRIRGIESGVPGEYFIPLCDLEGNRLSNFEVDIRKGVNPSTKKGCACVRPRLDSWSTEFTVEVNTSNIDPAMVKQLLEEAGNNVGIGDFRPEKTGDFGRFQVVLWEKAAPGKSANEKRKKELTAEASA